MFFQGDEGTGALSEEGHKVEVGQVVGGDDDLVAEVALQGPPGYLDGDGMVLGRPGSF